MTYAAFETSVHAGEPVELLRFSRGLESWRYTSSDGTFAHLSETYEPYPFSRPEASQTVEIAKGRLDFRTPVDTPVVKVLLHESMISIVELTIYRRHRGDAEVTEFWHGYVAGIQLEGSEAIVSCEQFAAGIRRIGRQRPAQRLCPHALFDGGCGLTAAAYGVTGTLISAAGSTLVSGVFASQPDGWWVGGMISAGNTMRMIVEHAADTVSLTSAIPGLAADAAFTVYPGCDHLAATCNSKFANIVNFGGLPWLPLKNPFNGDSSF